MAQQTAQHTARAYSCTGDCGGPIIPRATFRGLTNRVAYCTIRRAGLCNTWPICCLPATVTLSRQRLDAVEISDLQLQSYLFSYGRSLTSSLLDQCLNYSQAVFSRRTVRILAKPKNRIF